MVAVFPAIRRVRSSWCIGPCTGGRGNTINSQGIGFSHKYGYFEARIKFALERSGVGEGFFLMSQAHAQEEAQPASELDVVESPAGVPANILNTLHRDSAHPGDQQNAATGGNPWVDMGTDTTRTFHTYGALWDPNASTITWYFDGKPVMTQPKYDTTDVSPMFMDLLNVTGSGHMYIDYVRAWPFADQNATAVTPQAASPPFGQAVTNGSSLRSEARDRPIEACARTTRMSRFLSETREVPRARGPETSSEFPLGAAAVAAPLEPAV